jgi:hypothetical protein
MPARATRSVLKKDGKLAVIDHLRRAQVAKTAGTSPPRRSSMARREAINGKSSICILSRTDEAVLRITDMETGAEGEL